MKNLIKTIALSILLAVTFTSCEKSDVRPEDSNLKQDEVVSILVKEEAGHNAEFYTIVVNRGLPSEVIITEERDGGLNKKEYGVVFKYPHSLKTIEVINVPNSEGIIYDWGLSRVGVTGSESGLKVYQFSNKSGDEKYEDRYNWTR